ncbi:MAG: hypothetical protein SVO01_05130, partial [Thermotogota bacterium]|nr:hypothetical protein [Thermotogota bacterium]
PPVSLSFLLTFMRRGKPDYRRSAGVRYLLMRADENVMRSLLQRKDVSEAATPYPVPEYAINTDPIDGKLWLGIATI